MGEVKQRSAALDAVRVLGITAIVAGHVWTEGLPVREALYTWHVPIFFFLSGYLWTSGRTVRTEARNRTRTLLIPYAVWLVLISLVFIPWSIYRDSLPDLIWFRILLGGDYLGRPYSAFWFMSALFISALLFRLLERGPRWALWVVIVVGLVASWTVPTIVAAVPLSAGVAVPALVFVVAGQAFRRYRTLISRPLAIGAAALVISAVLVVTRVSAPLDMKYSDFGTPVVSVAIAVAISASLVLIAESLVPRVPRAISRAIIALAGCGTMVILTHAAVLWALGTPPTGSALAFAAALLVPWVLALVIARTPLAPYLIGSPRIAKGT